MTWKSWSVLFKKILNSNLKILQEIIKNTYIYSIEKYDLRTPNRNMFLSEIKLILCFLSRVKGMKRKYENMKIIFIESKFQCIYYIDIRLMHLELLWCIFFSWVEEKMIELSVFFPVLVFLAKIKIHFILNSLTLEGITGKWHRSHHIGPKISYSHVTTAQS